MKNKNEVYYKEVKCEDELPDTDRYLFVMEEGHYHLPNSCVYEKSDGLWFDRSGSIIDVDWWLKKLSPHPKEEQYVDCENCGQAVYVDGLYDGEWVICRECGLAGGVIIDEETSYISIQWIDSKEETDWNKLREQYFEECCEVIYKSYSPISSMKRVAMAPHDLFEWFKKRLSNPLKEEPKDSGWISVGDALPPLAPRSECAGEMPYSITVKVRDWGVLEYEAMYDYEHREWLQMPYENIIAERIVKWQSLPDPPTVETKKD